ncbi:hypothetical protein BJ875DRAFT_480353 [Amylocarpus encephaloides]|uniref:J domain-containing protein n=1 Tax=Amylocarpus encephaloides TaxID=45428 RepID=A0A9P7YRG2_9HELO|nr:hypothetical protein BJ875DRAFT_480353 [Amylocarpus encephaloides]
MPAASASGSDGKTNGAAHNRAHNQGNQDRKYTLEQKTAVLRVRRCSPTAFYEILGLEEVKATVTESEIKKAYRKLSLLTHPDKNGHEHADEAFKMVSRAFGILGDKEKKQKYDRYGGDPDSRFGGGSAPQASPFSGFGQRSSRAGGQPTGGGGSMWEEEISPEEMFNRFFGGGMGGGFGPFGGGTFAQGDGIFFNMGGGSGIRTHQFGGGRPQRRPRDPNAPPEPPPSLGTLLRGLLPILLVLIVPIISSLLFGSDSTPSGPQMRFDGPEAPQTDMRLSTQHKKEYWTSPADTIDYTKKMFDRMDANADRIYVQDLNYRCTLEEDERQRMIQDAQGWFFPDMQKLQKASKLPLKHCKTLGDLGMRRH